MSGALQALFQNQRSFIRAIGSAYEGGYYAGQISTSGNGIATHNLVIGPLSSAQSSSIKWKLLNTTTPGADSVINGPQNTADMVADGSSVVYPAAHFCNNLSIGGFSGWYMPAKNELEICYYNLRPTARNNTLSSGINTNAVPSRGSNYTAGDPAQTTATIFQAGGAQAFSGSAYWSSTEGTTQLAQVQTFFNGTQYSTYKAYVNYVRAVRRVAI